MKRQWENEELIEHWMLSTWDLAQLGNKTGATRLGFAVLLKFFQPPDRLTRLIQPYSGHATRQSLEIYSRLSPC